jgi:putative phage-type endonuclease
MIETIIPESRSHWLSLRAQNINSTEIAALFGCSPYSTAFELWHRKRNQVVDEFEPNERMLWGTRLERAIAEGIGDDYGLVPIRRAPEYIRHKDLRMGSSFDYFIGDDGILEIKNVDAVVFKNGWLGEGETIEAPPHIELQVQHQLALTGRQYAYIGALVGGNRAVLVKREPDPEIIMSIHAKVKSFWLSIQDGRAPSPDFEKDAGFISQLYSQSKSGKILDAKGDRELMLLTQGYRSLSDQIKELEAQRDAAKAQILMQIGDHEKVLSEEFSISAGMVPAKRIEFDRKEFRNFRINWKARKG